MMYLHIFNTVRFSFSVFWPSFLVCSLLPFMGPPPKGTRKYQRYLRSQKQRRQAQRAERTRKVLQNPVVKQALAEAYKRSAQLQQELDKAALRSNRHFRQTSLPLQLQKKHTYFQQECILAKREWLQERKKLEAELAQKEQENKCLQKKQVLGKLVVSI